MTAQEWIEEDGANTACDFDAYGGVVTLARVGSNLYVELTDDYKKQCETVESKEILRMAHWIIKEFG